VRWIVAVAAITFVGPALARGKEGVASLCSGSEETIFSCQTKGSAKILSVCASPSVSSSDGYLQYRYGTVGALELEFPAQRSQSVGRFRTAHYFRAQVDRRELSFMNEEVRYTVFSYFEGEEKPSHRETGVTVRKQQEPPRTLPCRGASVDHLDELDDVVACDPDSPLSMGSCP
jgi:hypothetical protein